MDIPAFRAAFPEFSNSEVYPTPMVTVWAALAERQVRECIWKDTRDLGVQLYVAHELVLAAANNKTAKFKGAPGTFGGVPSDKTVGSASVSYDALSTTEKDAGYWNLTTYGKQFIRLARIFGAGAIQL